MSPPNRQPLTGSADTGTPLRCGSSLMEVMLVMTIIAILISVSVPSFHRVLEQSRADLSAANLRAVWSAQRLYWLEYRTYAADLSALQSLGLLDPSIPSSQVAYTYQVQFANANSFVATASRVPNARWNGTFSIDDAGVVSGVLKAPGEQDIAPGFQ